MEKGPSWKHLMKSRMGQFGDQTTQSATAPPGGEDDGAVVPNGDEDRHLKLDADKPPSAVKGEGDVDTQPVLTRQRSSSSASNIPHSPNRRQANSQHILDVLTIAQQVGSKAIAGTHSSPLLSKFRFS
jgi:hypothetical protein